MSFWGRLWATVLGPWRLTDSGLVLAFGGRRASSGIAVNEYTALNTSAVWACVRAIADPLATLPVYLYRRTGDDSRERATAHPAYRLLASRPNPRMTPAVFRRTLQAHVLTWGNGYAEIVRDGADRPAELWPVTPNRVRVEHDTDSSEVRYRVDGTKLIPSRDMIHLVGLSFDGLVGYSVVRVAAESLGLTAATERYGSSWFGNGGRPNGVLSHPKRLSDPGRRQLRADWNEVHGGPDNAGQVAILHEGVTYAPIGLPPEDSQFLGTRQFQVLEVCRWFGVPPHRIFELSRATFSNIEFQGQEFLTYTLDPWNTGWEQELGYKLLSDEERDAGLYFETHTDRLLRTNLQARYAAYATARQWGWMSANDALRRENQPTIGQQGDIYLVPGNMVPAQQAGRQQQANTNRQQALARKVLLDHRGEPILGGDRHAVA